MNAFRLLMTRICRVKLEYRELRSLYLPHDNARLHTAYIIQQYIAKNQITVRHRLSYCAIFGISRLFSILKSQVGTSHTYN